MSKFELNFQLHVCKFKGMKQFLLTCLINPMLYSDLVARNISFELWYEIKGIKAKKHHFMTAANLRRRWQNVVSMVS